MTAGPDDVLAHDRLTGDGSANESSTSGQPPRRAVLKGAAVGGLAMVGGVALAACGAGTSNVTRPKTPLAQLDDLTVGGGEVVKGPNGERYVLVRSAADEVTAFNAACTHKGCPVSLRKDGVLACPCHGSEFVLATGAVVQGPASKPLRQVAVSVTNGEITLA